MIPIAIAKAGSASRTRAARGRGAGARRPRASDAALAADIASTYGELRRRAVRPFDGAIETVRWLRGLNLRLALITNGSALDQRERSSASVSPSFSISS
jgi:FMN phosphatase YigB (HAD superfamily)